MSAILLDTNVLLLFLAGSSRLSSKTRAAIEDTDSSVWFSAASIWEIAIKSQLDRGDFNVDPVRIAPAAHESGFAELSITAEVAAGVANLPAYHRDPFDRLLVAQSMSLPARLYTTDRVLVQYSELVTFV